MKSLVIIFFAFILSLTFLQAQDYTYQELISHSVNYLNKEEYLLAEQSLKAALKKEPANPGNIVLFSNLAAIQRHLKKYDEALTSYNIVLSKYPTSVNTLHNRADLYCEIDSLNLALRDYNTILLAEQDNIEALRRRAFIYMNKGDLDNAEYDFVKIKQVSPDKLEGDMGLALILKRRDKWEEALELYSDLLYENRTNTELFINRAECYLQQKKLAKALDDLDKAVQYKSVNPLLYILKGQVRLQQFDKFSAKTDFLKARELGADSLLVDDLLKYCR